MLITVWDVFCAPIFQQCNPQITAGAAGMRNAVRWAYTQERYDVTEFLVGGEILIIEGSALAEHADDEGLIAYVDALHRAKVSALWRWNCWISSTRFLERWRNEPMNLVCR